MIHGMLQLAAVAIAHFRNEMATVTTRMICHMLHNPTFFLKKPVPAREFVLERSINHNVRSFGLGCLKDVCFVG